MFLTYLLYKSFLLFITSLSMYLLLQRKKTKAKKAASIAASIFASLAAQDAQEDLTAGLFDDI